MGYYGPNKSYTLFEDDTLDKRAVELLAVLIRSVRRSELNERPRTRERVEQLPGVRARLRRSVVWQTR